MKHEKNRIKFNKNIKKNETNLAFNPILKSKAENWVNNVHELKK